MRYLVLPENKIGRTFVVGDIHGMYDLLISELNKPSISFDYNKDRLICVGDLVDRGRQCYKTTELLDFDNNWFFSVRGNHEQMCIDGVENVDMARMHSQSNNGGMWFYMLSDTVQKCIASKFEDLPFAIETVVDGYRIGFTHADVFDDWDEVRAFNDWRPEPGAYSYARQPEDHLMWSRDRVKKTMSSDAMIKNIDRVFMGHTPLNAPKHLGNCSWIDTGAVFGGHFTLIDISKFMRDVNDKT